MKGVLLENGTTMYADQIIYSGTVWNLYQKLLPDYLLTDKERTLAAQIPTYPSLVLYALIDANVIPKDTCPIEMLSAKGATDESEVTVYILSMDDRTLCPENLHTLVAVGPSLQNFTPNNPVLYQSQKETEIQRLLSLLEERFPGLSDAIVHVELATPHTIERYTLKNGGAAAGPKQMLGQHMLLRQSIRTRFTNLFCCGESTTMGTGTPSVTTSGIAAANAILKEQHLKPYTWKQDMPNYVDIIQPPIEAGWQYSYYKHPQAEMMQLASKCQYCTNPSCCTKKLFDIPGIMRRVTCGNMVGAKKLITNNSPLFTDDFLTECEEKCVQQKNTGNPVAVKKIINYLLTYSNN